MRDIAKLGEKVEELRSEILALTELSDEEITTEQAERLDPALAEFETAKAELAKAEERAAKVAAVRDTTVAKPEAVRTERSAPAVVVRQDPFEALEGRAGMSRVEYRKALVDGVIRSNEHRVEGTEAQANLEKLVKRHGGDLQWAEDLLARSRPEYESGFLKAITGRDFSLTNEERTALSTLTNANGKYAVPVHLDPSLILTNNGTSNVIRSIARVVTLGRENVWNGLSSAGVTASWDTELSEVSDDTPTFAQPTIPTYTARAFAQYSIQSEEDIEGLAGMLLELFADARDRHEGAAHANGSGSSQPFGIFPALVGTSSVVQSGTAATIALADLNSLYTTLPVRYRGKSTWVYNPQVGAAIKALGTAVSASFSGDLRDPYAGRINGRPVLESDDAPFVSTTTVLDPRIVLGDFSNFVIVDKPGSTVIETIPHMFHTSNNLPMGARGAYMQWRNGSDSVNDAAFVLLQDKTSA